MKVLLLALLLPQAQTDWAQAGKDWFTQWKAGRISLLLPWPRSNPYVLDAGDRRVEEMLRAKGASFYWTHEAELGMVCSGIAAEIGGDGRDLLRSMALVPNGGRPGGELRSSGTTERQPWILRRTAREAIARSPDAASRQAAVAVLADEGADAEALVLACALLEACGDFSEQAALAARLGHDDPLVRVAAARALGHIAGQAALDAILDRLEKEAEPRVRGHLWSAVIRPVEALGDWRERAEKDAWKRAVSLAARRLFADGATVVEKLAIAEFMWRARPDLFLSRLPEALAAAQGDGPGQARLRWWFHGLLVDMVGRGFLPRRRVPGQDPETAPTDPGPTEVEAWRRIVQQRTTPQGRRIQSDQPPLPTDGPRLFGLPVQGRRLLFLVDCSPCSTAPGCGPGPRAPTKTARPGSTSASRPSSRRCSRPSPTGPSCASRRRRGGAAVPRRGWLTLDARSRPRLGKVLAGLRGAGEADLATPLFHALGVERGLPVNLGVADEERPDAIYLLASPLVRKGPVQSADALVDLVLGAWPGDRVPVFVAYVQDRRPTTSDPGYRLHASWTLALRRLATGTHAGMGYAMPTTRRD
ncbi:MAG: HEAT repeat domain-containing protein [Planctomycetota bacterium]